MFSSRLPPQLAPNALAQAVDDARRSEAGLIDLTQSNPTAVGLSYPPDLLASLAHPGASVYRPDPLGTAEARAVIAAAFRTRGAAIEAEQVVLTASTSEAYALLFKLLCDPGDSILVPQPSYPLFDLLLRLEGVHAVPYRLRRAGDWDLDRDSVQRSITAASRAILVVSPNNPTGSMLRAADRDWLSGLARERDLALISDEVFADYPLSPRPDAASLAGHTHALTFTLGGLSKSVGLPQLKLAWMAASGPPDRLREALMRLELIADTYLSVSTPVQLAAPQLLTAGRAIRQAIADRIRRNLSVLRAKVRTSPSLTLLEPEGGWSAVLRVPALESEERIVLRVLTEGQVLVHPGYFFDFDEEAFVVLSLRPGPEVFAEGLARLERIVTRGPA